MANSAADAVSIVDALGARHARRGDSGAGLARAGALTPAAAGDGGGGAEERGGEQDKKEKEQAPLERGGEQDSDSAALSHQNT